MTARRGRAWNFERHTLWIWCCRNTWKTCQMLRTCHKQFKKKVQLHHNAYWNKSLVNNNNLHPPAPMWNLFHEENEHKNTNTVWLLPARRNASWQQQCKLSKPWHGPLHTYMDRNENFEYHHRRGSEFSKAVCHDDRINLREKLRLEAFNRKNAYQNCKSKTKKTNSIMYNITRSA